MFVVVRKPNVTMVYLKSIPGKKPKFFRKMCRGKKRNIAEKIPSCVALTHIASHCHFWRTYSTIHHWRRPVMAESLGRDENLVSATVNISCYQHDWDQKQHTCMCDNVVLCTVLQMFLNGIWLEPSLVRTFAMGSPYIIRHKESAHGHRFEWGKQWIVR